MWAEERLDVVLDDEASRVVLSVHEIFKWTLEIRGDGRQDGSEAPRQKFVDTAIGLVPQSPHILQDVTCPVQADSNPRVERPPTAPMAVATLVGFTAVTGQIVLMREVIVLFNGNELSLGIVLGAWLGWTAAGSSLISWLMRRRSRHERSAIDISR